MLELEIEDPGDTVHERMVCMEKLDRRLFLKKPRSFYLQCLARRSLVSLSCWCKFSHTFENRVNVCLALWQTQKWSKAQRTWR
jgi:hypothetical protein